MNSQNKYHFTASISNFPSHKIFIEVMDLEVGEYELIIIHKRKTIKKTTFKKEKS